MDNARLRKIFSGLVLGILFAMFSYASGYAQDETPLWAENLGCDPTQEFQGVSYCSGVIRYTDGGSTVVHVLVVDTTSPGVQIEYIIPEGIDANGVTEECKDVNRSTKVLDRPHVGCDDPADRSLYPVFSLHAAVDAARERFTQLNLAFLINGDYSACTISLAACGVDKYGYPQYREHGPEGLTVVRGNRLDGSLLGDGDNNAVNRPWLVISEDAPLTAEIHQLLTDEGEIPYVWVYTAVGGAPWLIQDGTVHAGAIANCTGATLSSCRNGASQTAVGVTRDGRWLFFVLGIQPRTLLDLANFMDTELDVWRAIKFDGGGSSQLYYSEAADAYVEEGDGRLLTNYLAIFAQPASEPTCPPTDCTYGKDVGREFFVQVVENLDNVPVTELSVQALQAWQPYEGTKACWNPLATTWKMDPVCYFNCLKYDDSDNCISGVQDYQDQDMGSLATAKTLNLSYYDAIRRMLRHDDFDREALRVSLDTWGTCSGTGCDSLLDTWKELYDSASTVPEPDPYLPPDPDEPPDPGDDLNLLEEFLAWLEQTWQSITQGIEDWLQEQGETLAQRIEEWWTDLVRRLLEILGEQLAQWCNSMCGMALLPGGAIATAWYVRRRKAGPKA